MVENADKLGKAVTTAKDNRVTKTGKLLRKFKLDELPQLFNVLKGDMSLVGPRPEVLKYVEQFKGDYNHILKIKPGITDYAALKYRNEEEILAKYDNTEQAYISEVLPEKIKLYKQYMEEVSFMVDIKIILNTLVRIVK
jgi:lipopolysaccharide/colanic/teichoic acid biosynthesis glycosyltransferase